MNYWKDVRLRQVIPAEHLTIPEVFELIGRRHLGPSGEWSGEELAYEDLGPAFARPKDVFEGDSSVIKNAALYSRDVGRVLTLLGKADAPHLMITNDQWCEATDKWHKWSDTSAMVVHRRNTIFSIMYRLGMSRSFGAGLGYCYIDAQGQIRELDVSQWHCAFEVACDRFTTAALCTNPLYVMHRPNPFDGGRDYLEHFAVPIFVARDNLKAVLPKIPVYDRAKVTDPDADPAISMVARFEAELASTQTSIPEAAAPKPSPSSAPPSTAPKPVQKRKGGPRPREWVTTLYRIFEQHHQRIVGLSQRELLAEVDSLWPKHLRAKPGSAVTVDKHRTIYLEQRAETARRSA